MTTAREQAREAAKKHVYDVMQHGGYTGPEPAADAASDVWEPLLREAVALIEKGSFSHTHPTGRRDGHRSVGDWRTDFVARAKEALG